MKIPFYKCNANGNSFIIILHFNSIDDNFFNSKNIKEICHTIDNDIVDGFITINISDKGYFMDYYNNNGSWETLCINGLRCTAMLIKNNTSQIRSVSKLLMPLTACHHACPLGSSSDRGGTLCVSHVQSRSA